MKYDNIRTGKLRECFNDIFWSASYQDETVESLKKKMNSLKKTYDLDHNEENQYKYLLSTWQWLEHGN